MITNYGTYELINFRVADFCKVSTKSVLLEYWNTLPLFDEMFVVEAGTYITHTKYKKN